MIELPVAVGAQGDEVINAAHDGHRRIERECADSANVANLDMFIIATVLADTQQASPFEI